NGVTGQWTAGAGPLGDVVALSRAETKMVEDEYAEARRIAREVLSRRPEHTRALRIVAWSEYRLGNFRAAQEAFGRLEELDPRHVDAPIGLGWTSFKLGDLNDAESHFLKAKDLPTEYFEEWDINDGLGWIAYARGNLDQAEAYFRYTPQPEIYNNNVDWGWQKDSLVGRGMVALARSQLADARDLFAEGVRQDPAYFRPYDGLARGALLERRYEAALRHALAGLDRVRYHAGLFFLLEAILEKLDAPERSARIYAELAERHPDVPAYRNGVGKSQLALGRLKEAEASYVASLKADPDNPRAKEGLVLARARMNKFVADGWTRYFEGDYEGALAAFRAKRAQAAGADNPAAETGRGWALLALGRIPEAGKAFAAAVRIDPHFAAARDGIEALAQPHLKLYEQAWALAEAGKFERARRQFLRAGKHAPADFLWKIDDGQAWLAFYKKDFKKAERAFTDILRKSPNAYLSRKGLGYIALKRGQYAVAKTHLLAALNQSPKQVLTSYTFPAVHLLAARQYKTALAILELGEKTYPQSADIQFLLAKAYKGLKDHARAAAKAVKSATLAPVYIHPAFDDIGLKPSTVTDAYLAMARGLFFAGDTEGTRKRVEAYFKAGGKDPEGFRLRGFVSFRQGRFREANADLKLAAPHEPEALSPVTQVVPIPGTDRRWQIVYNARSTLAWSHLRLGNARRAAAEFRKVLKTYPNWIDALTGLGYSLLALGDREGAVRSFRRALVISPAYPDAWQGLDLVKARA
ncbi:MAG: tetratricopeptide repeat protein, partial [Rhodospirillales bacterium]